MSNSNKISGLENILRNKDKIIKAGKEKRTLLLNHERTGLSFVFWEPSKHQISDFREKLKSRKIKIESENYTEKQENVVIEFEAEILALNLKTMFLTEDSQEEADDIDLKNEDLKKAYEYSLPYEFFYKVMTEREIDVTFSELVGFSNTIKK
jgi:hypothetical protein